MQLRNAHWASALASVLAALIVDGAAAQAPREEAARSGFDILEFDIEGNSKLSAIAIERAVYRYLGPGGSIEKVEKAREALEHFDEAIALNHTEPEFHVYRAYALFRVRGPDAAEESKAAVHKALAAAPGLASGYLFLGLMARDTGAPEEAERLFEKALEKNPKYEWATRELRALRMHQERRAGKGLLGKLFGR